MKYSNSGGTADDDSAVRPEILYFGRAAFNFHRCSPDTVNLRKDGRNFMSGIYRTKTINQITEEDIGTVLKIAGWVENIRDHGGFSFIDLRDMYGVMQVVFRNTRLLKGIRKEECLSIEDVVEKRDEETYNPRIPTGTIELAARKVTVLGRVYKDLPFEITTSMEIREEVRLKYRYLDLINRKVKDSILFRSQVISFLRQKMTDMGFGEIQTPILSVSSPEGARDYIVPSRKYKGKFYALPQALQIYKQLLMVAGFDKYFQIAPCFRDEDARADRSPGEFCQLDFESEDIKGELAQIAGLIPGDVIFFIADREKLACKYAGLIRNELGKRLDLCEKKAYRFCYVNDFPMYEIDEVTGRVQFTHNPFSMPQGGLEALNTKGPLDILACQYDIVCNGVELSSGVVRNHDLDIMVKAFEIAGYDEETLKKKFKALYNTFQYGAPPHAGMAPGVERMIMLLRNEENIREVMAFPMNSNAQDLMCGAPSEVTEQQLREVHIKIRN